MCHRFGEKIKEICLGLLWRRCQILIIFYYLALHYGWQHFPRRCSLLGFWNDKYWYCHLNSWTKQYMTIFSVSSTLFQVGFNHDWFSWTLKNTVQWYCRSILHTEQCIFQYALTDPAMLLAALHTNFYSFTYPESSLNRIFINRGWCVVI